MMPAREYPVNYGEPKKEISMWVAFTTDNRANGGKHRNGGIQKERRNTDEKIGDKK